MDDLNTQDSATQNGPEKPLHERIAAMESGFAKVLHTLEKIAPVLAIIPGVGQVASGAIAVGEVIEHAIDASNGVVAVDSAALAAGHIANSTGNDALDARLASIELHLELASPLLQYLAREFGLNAPTPFTAPATATFNAFLTDAETQGA